MLRKLEISLRFLNFICFCPSSLRPLKILNVSLRIGNFPTCYTIRDSYEFRILYTHVICARFADELMRDSRFADLRCGPVFTRTIRKCEPNSSVFIHYALFSCDLFTVKSTTPHFRAL